MLGYSVMLELKSYECVLTAPVGRRPVWFDAAGATETPVYRREALGPGLRFEGPAIVDQLDATTPVWPGDRVEVRPDGSLAIALKGAA